MSNHIWFSLPSTLKTVEHQVIAGTNTSEFFGRSNDFNAKNNASVPFAQPTVYLVPQNLNHVYILCDLQISS